MAISPKHRNNSAMHKDDRRRAGGMRPAAPFAAWFLAALMWALFGSAQTPEKAPAIRTLDPPEKEFFSKALDFHGIPIKAHAAVSNEALYAAYERLTLLL